MEDVTFYYLSLPGTERDNRMVQRFNTLNIPAQRVECVSQEWLAENGYQGYGCMFGHIKMLTEFVERSDKEFCMVFEDDVYISKDLTSDIKFLCNRMRRYKLDILLTGYLVNYIPATVTCQPWLSKLDMIGFYNYPHDLWGTQSYIVTRSYATTIISKYNEEYLKQTLQDSSLTPFSSDWTITKYGNRAMVYPMYAVEEGNINSTHSGQINFHKDCTSLNYNPDIYV